MATVTGWPPDNNGHIFTCLSQPPENTVVPSSFQAEHRTCQIYKIQSIMNTPTRVSYGNYLDDIYRLIM